MYQPQYRNWVNSSFQTLLREFVLSSAPFTTRELAKEIRLIAGDENYLHPDTCRRVHDCQAHYTAVVRNNGDMRHLNLFYEYGDRLTRALNTAVRLGWIKRELNKVIELKDHSYVTNTNVKRHIYKYSLV